MDFGLVAFDNIRFNCKNNYADHFFFTDIPDYYSVKTSIKKKECIPSSAKLKLGQENKANFTFSSYVYIIQI